MVDPRNAGRNTGTKDARGRTIYRGPRGGLYVRLPGGGRGKPATTPRPAAASPSPRSPRRRPTGVLAMYRQIAYDVAAGKAKPLTRADLEGVAPRAVKAYHEALDAALRFHGHGRKKAPRRERSLVQGAQHAITKAFTEAGKEARLGERPVMPVETMAFHPLDKIRAYHAGLGRRAPLALFTEMGRAARLRFLPRKPLTADEQATLSVAELKAYRAGLSQPGTLGAFTEMGRAARLGTRARLTNAELATLSTRQRMAYLGGFGG